jgi:hypothetical protein
MTGKPTLFEVLSLTAGCVAVVLSGLLCGCDIYGSGDKARAKARRAALQSEARQMRSHVMLALAARQDALDQITAVMANSAESSGILADGADAENRFALWAGGAMSDTDLVDMVLMADSKGQVTSRWSRPGNSLVPESMPQVSDDVPAGLLILPKCGPVVFARHAMPKDPNGRELWAVTLIDASLRTSLWGTIGGELALVPWQGPLRKDPDATKIDADAQWVSSEDRLSVSWLVRDANDEVIAFFRASQPIPPRFRDQD